MGASRYGGDTSLCFIPTSYDVALRVVTLYTQMSVTIRRATVKRSRIAKGAWPWPPIPSTENQEKRHKKGKRFLGCYVRSIGSSF